MRLRGLGILVALTAAACGTESSGGSASATASEDASAAYDTAVDDAGAEQDSSEQDSGPTPSALKPYAGTCPTLESGLKVLDSNGLPRRIRVYLPAEPSGAPVVFIWHGLGDSASNIASALGAQKMADEDGAIVVAPESCCNHSSTQACCQMISGWGWAGKPEPDAALFDDVLSCLDQQYGIDRHRVYTTGFSAGGLWSTWLTMHRSNYLAAAAIWSGGTGDVLPYVKPEYRIPVMLGWGGPDDIVVLTFADMATALRDALRLDGHSVIACDHGKGHTVPFPGPTSARHFLFAQRWQDGSNPFSNGLDAAFPSWCEVVP